MTAGAALLTPGAGATRNSPALIALAEALAPLPTSRVDFPYRVAGKHLPDRPPVAIAHLREQAGLLLAEHDLAPEQLVLGGRSYGGRMCSMAVADGLPAAGLILLSYPLHPPGRPQQLRIDHLPRIAVPVLAISGNRDPFGTPEELTEHLSTISGPLTLQIVDGNHDPMAALREILDTVVDWVAALP